MDKEWVEGKNREQEIQRKRLLSEIKTKIENTGIFTEDEIQHLMDKIVSDLNDPLGFAAVAFDLGYTRELAIQKFGEGKSQEKLDYIDGALQLNLDLKQEFDNLFRTRYDFSRFQDSEPVEFDGDIIITDPCYILKSDNDWKRSDCGYHLELLGIKHFMTRDTIYGDWGCTVFDLNNNHAELGQFCADAGMVSVMLLDEVLSYNPSFNYHLERKWTTSLIKDFKGSVQFVVHESNYEHGGKIYTDYEVEVVGHGVNKCTGKPIDFIGGQTDL